MATLEQIERALRAADAAGNTEDARRLAQAYAQMRDQQRPQADFSGVTGGVESTAPVAQDPKTPWIQGEGRGYGIGARSVLQGAGSLLGAIGGDAFNMALNKVLPGEVPSYREVGGQIADRIGLPSPETPQERIHGDVGEALTGTGLTMGAGGLLSLGRAALGPVASRIGSFLTAQPGMQVAGTAAGSGASATAREEGAGQGTQLAAGLAGALAPGAATSGSAATLRGLIRGADGQPMRNRLSDFSAVGASPSLGQATGRHSIQGIENLLAGGPTSSGVMSRFAAQQADDIGAGLQSRGQALTPNASGERAGRAILRGIHGPDGFTQRFKETQRQLYDRLDTFIPAQQRIGVSNTQRALQELNAPIEGAPNTSRLFTNSRIAGIGRALDQDLATPTDAQRALDDALGRLDSLYASRDSAMQDWGRFTAMANTQANRAHQWHPVEGVPRAPGRYAPHTDRAREALEAAGDAGAAAAGNVSRAQAIESTLADLTAAAQAQNGRLPYEAIKKLRTLVGQEIDNAGLMSDFPRDKWKALYRALSEDLGAAAQEAGPEAAQAFSRANNYSRMGMERVESIRRVVDKNGGPEAVFNAVMSGTRDGGSTLRSVMQSLPEDGQKAVTAAVIRRMGMATPGMQDATGELFSAQTFLTNWNRVSPEAKRALFDRHGPQFSRDMDKIARVAETIREGSQVFRNPSGTANKGAAYTYGAALVASLFDATGISTAGVVGGGVGANLAARALTNPTAVRWLARATDAPIGAAPAMLHELRAAAQRDNDEDLLEIVDQLEQAVPHASNAAQP